MDTPHPIPQPPDLPPVVETPRRSFAKWAAILSLWSPFVCIPVTIGLLVYSDRNTGPAGENAGPLWVVFAISGVGFLIATLGFALGVFGLLGIKRHGRKGLFGRSLFGTIANGLLVAFFTFGIAALAIEFLPGKTQRPLTNDEKAESQIKKMDRMRASLNKTADRENGDLSLVAAVTARRVGQTKSVMNDYYQKSQLVAQGVFLDPKNLTSREQLVKNIAQVENFIEADRRMEAFSKSYEQDYSNDLKNAGVSDAALKAAMDSVHGALAGKNPLVIELVEAHGRWGESQLSALNLLESNWGGWTINTATKKLEFKDNARAHEFNEFVDAINEAHAEAVSAREKLDNWGKSK
jgi:hypothetical protein